MNWEEVELHCASALEDTLAANRKKKKKNTTYGEKKLGRGVSCCYVRCNPWSGFCDDWPWCLDQALDLHGGFSALAWLC